MDDEPFNPDFQLDDAAEWTTPAVRTTPAPNSTTNSTTKSHEHNITRGLDAMCLLFAIFLVVLVLRRTCRCGRDRKKEEGWQRCKSSVLQLADYLGKQRTRYLFQQPSHQQFLRLQSLLFRLTVQIWFFSLFAMLFNALANIDSDTCWFERINLSNVEPGSVFNWFREILVVIPAAFVPLYHIRRHVRKETRLEDEAEAGSSFFRRQEEESLAELRVAPSEAVAVEPKRWLPWILFNGLLVAMILASSALSVYILGRYDEIRQTLGVFTEWASQLVVLLTQALTFLVLVHSSTMNGRKIQSFEFFLKLFVLYFFTIAVLPTLGLAGFSSFFDATYRQDSWKGLFLPDTGGNFINYLVVSAITSTVGDVMAPAQRIVFWYRRLQSRANGEPRQVEFEPIYETFFEERLANWLAHFALVVMYSVSCPLVTSAGVVYFVLQRFAVLHKLGLETRRRPVCAVEHLDKRMLVWALVIIILCYLVLQLTMLGFSLMRHGFRGPSIFILVVMLVHLAVSALLNWNSLVPYFNLLLGRPVFDDVGHHRQKGVPKLLSFKPLPPASTGNR